LIYQDLDELIEAARFGNPAIEDFDTSCFDSRYVTGDVNQEYLDHLAEMRNDGARNKQQVSDENLIDLSNSADINQ
jgi:amidophosphoribosyltransferase